MIGCRLLLRILSSKSVKNWMSPPDTLLAITGKIPTPIKEAIGENPAAQQFLREAQTMTLTDDEWGTLTQQLKKLR